MTEAGLPLEFLFARASAQAPWDPLLLLPPLHRPPRATAGSEPLKRSWTETRGAAFIGRPKSWYEAKHEIETTRSPGVLRRRLSGTRTTMCVVVFVFQSLTLYFYNNVTGRMLSRSTSKSAQFDYQVGAHGTSLGLGTALLRLGRCL